MPARGKYCEALATYLMRKRRRVSLAAKLILIMVASHIYIILHSFQSTFTLKIKFLKIPLILTQR